MARLIPTPDTVREALPAQRERPPEQYAVDGATPQIALRPETRDEVAAALVAAHAARAAVVPQGARTAIALGRPIARYDIALDVRGLDRVIAYEPDDLTVTVEAGVTLDTLQRTLSEHGQYLSVDAPPDDRVTVGGLLATARPGAWRGHLPGQRDLVLGMTVALPDGSLVTSGGRVVKNVSGYDMHRMHTGALGALGVIVEASFKVAPLPRAARSLMVSAASLDRAQEIALAVWDRALATRAISVLSAQSAQSAGAGGSDGVLIDLAGPEAALERSLHEVRELATAAAASASEVDDEPWRRLRALAGDSDATVLRLGVPPAEVARGIAAAETAGCIAWGHLAAGSVLARAETIAAPAAEQLRALASGFGGFLQIESAPVALRSAVDPFAGGEVELMRSLKRQFDPLGTLNPGRWREGL